MEKTGLGQLRPMDEHDSILGLETRVRALWKWSDTYREETEFKGSVRQPVLLNHTTFILPPFLNIYDIIYFSFPNFDQQYCNEYDTIYAISSDFGDYMTTQSMGLMVLLSEHL